MCFSEKICISGKKCPECGDLVLFHLNFPINQLSYGLLYITVRWKRHEYVTMDASSSLVVSSKRIKFLEDELLVPEFMEKFQILRHQTLS